MSAQCFHGRATQASRANAQQRFAVFYVYSHSQEGIDQGDAVCSLILTSAGDAADIEYGFAEAATTYGRIGVKVWIYKGEVLNTTLRAAAPEPAPRERRDRRNGDRRRDGERRERRNNGDRPYNRREGGNR